MAIKLVAVARKHNYRITVQKLFEWPTIAKLAQRCTAVENEKALIEEIERYSLLRLNPDEIDQLLYDEIEKNGIAPSEVDDMYPCAPLQEALFAIGLRTKSDYLAQQVFICGDALNIDRLKAAWLLVIEANPILRTTIMFTNSGHSHLSGLQVVLGKESIDWRQVNVEKNESMDEALSKVLEDDRERGIEAGKLLTRFTVLTSEDGVLYFIWTIHHTLYDGWSMDLILNDLVTAYQGQEVAARPSYSHFINYNLQLSREESINYWSNVLNGVTNTCISKASSLSQKVEAPKVMTSRIPIDFAEITTKHNITLATIINLAWAIVLKYHTGNSDVVFGTVNSGRNVPVDGIDQICGPCLTTLPVRVKLEEDLTIAEVMSGMHVEQLEQYRYQNIGLQDIQKECINVQNANLFDSLIVVQNLGMNNIDALMSSVGLVAIKSVMIPDFPLVVEILIGTNNHEITIHYDERRVPLDEVNSLLGHFRTALVNIEANASTLVNDFSIISQSEYQLLDMWGSALIDNINHGCIHTLFEEQVLRTPNNIAVQFEKSEYVTYSELNRRANRLAYFLIESGVGVESLVPLCFDKSIDMVVAMLAVLKAGGAYVPMDPSNPDERNHFIIQETQARIVVTTGNFIAKFAEMDVTTIDTRARLLSSQSVDNPVLPGLNSRNLCYVIYTSGSTGTPKGVMLEHASVVNFITGLNTIWNQGWDDNILQFASYTFDASVVTIFATLLTGARICMASKESLLSNLGGIIESMNITCAELTPTVASQIQPLECPSLKKLILGGEMVTNSIRDTWAPHVQLSNGYGPTEAAVGVTINHSVSESTQCRNVGMPLPNNKIFILDSNLRIVPLGVVGELCISGIQLARGYLNRPDLTAKTFVENPFTPGERMYLTGDLANFMV
ncbi:hypothetical protein K7432_016610 [Basidiobolus ranarum]|uniref:Uncharacterized protein n=1 Tax=Basidiobolus ranarum TaxID=34480 RepID=A0ABR2VLE7_9FUNG